MACQLGCAEAMGMLELDLKKVDGVVCEFRTVLDGMSVGVAAGGNVFPVWASKILNTPFPPQIWDVSSAQGISQSVWLLVQELPTKKPHQHSPPSLTPAYT
jgi:hypothetical protein